MKKIDTWLGIQRYIAEASHAANEIPKSNENFEVVARIARAKIDAKHQRLRSAKTRRAKRFLRALQTN